MAANAAAFAGRRLLYYPYVEDAKGAGRGLIAALGQDACLIVTDWYPAFFLPRMLEAAADAGAGAARGCGLERHHPGRRARPRVPDGAWVSCLHAAGAERPCPRRTRLRPDVDTRSARAHARSFSVDHEALATGECRDARSRQRRPRVAADRSRRASRQPCAAAARPHIECCAVLSNAGSSDTERTTIIPISTDRAGCHRIFTSVTCRRMTSSPPS